MTTPRPRTLGAALLVLALALSAVLGHVLLSSAPQSPWTAAVLLGPMIVITLVWLWRAGRRLATVLGTVASLILAWAIVEQRLPAQAIYLLQHAGIHAALAAWFWSTLQHTPLIVQVARRVHPMTPAMEAYARQVTWVWVLYFVGMALVSVALFLHAEFETWSLFATVLTPLSVVALFAGEHVMRYRLHPEFERVTMKRALRAWREGPSSEA